MIDFFTSLSKKDKTQRSKWETVLGLLELDFEEIPVEEYERENKRIELT